MKLTCKVQFDQPDMKSLKSLLAVTILLCGLGFALVAEPVAPVPYPHGAVSEKEPFVHDPVIAEERGRFYLFHTGPGINVWESEDMVHWSSLESVFPEVPQWMYETIPGFRGHLWAPDIYRHGGKWYLYYSVSAFGRNTSFIGVATTLTLDPSDPDFGWTDHGIVIQSFPGLHNWNAIDAAIVEDADGTPWMSFGSFWSGLQLVQLAECRTRLANPADPEVILIASRNPGPSEMPESGYPEQAGNGAIEAPYLVLREGYYYLFASIDYCCRGPDSNYKVVVGRSRTIQGPYLDRNGVSMLDGGGSLLLEGGGRWYGLGHNGVTPVGGEDYLVYHAYDGEHPRAWARLQVRQLRWQDGWPVVGDLLW
jgi:arabinan endo-1,5-alpha-L-arabinosidase